MSDSCIGGLMHSEMRFNQSWHRSWLMKLHLEKMTTHTHGEREWDIMIRDRSHRRRTGNTHWSTTVCWEMVPGKHHRLPRLCTVWQKHSIMLSPYDVMSHGWFILQSPPTVSCCCVVLSQHAVMWYCHTTLLCGTAILLCGVVLSYCHITLSGGTVTSLCPVVLSHCTVVWYSHTVLSCRTVTPHCCVVLWHHCSVVLSHRAVMWHYHITRYSHTMLSCGTVTSLCHTTLWWHMIIEK